MRVAIFSDSFPPQIDGVSSVAYQSALGLAKRGHRVSVVAPSVKARSKESPPGNLEIHEIPSVPFVGYPGHRIAFPFGYGKKFLSGDPPDIVHSHTPFAAGWEAVRAARYFSVPLIGTNHTFFDHYLRHVKLDYAWAQKLSWRFVINYYNRCHHVTSPSRSLLESMRFHGLKPPLSLLSNPVNTELFSPPADNGERASLKKKFGMNGISAAYMGRVSYEKSIDQALRAFALAKAKVPELTFMVIGDGPERPKLEMLAKDLGIRNSVIFTGFKRGSKLADAVRANDIFVTASKSENMPVSLLEAMAAGLPVVGVKALGVPETALHGRNALVAEPDAIEEIGAHIVLLSRDQDLRKKFSAASREIALTYSSDSIAETLENLYLEVGAEKPSRLRIAEAV